MLTAADLLNEAVLTKALQQVVDELRGMKNDVAKRAFDRDGTCKWDPLFGAREYAEDLQRRISELERLIYTRPLYVTHVPEWAAEAVERKMTEIIRSLVFGR